MGNNLFGTDGIRGTLGTYPFTVEHLPLVGKAIGEWAQEKYGATPTILLGHDTRQSCSFVKAALHTGLLMHPVNVYDAHVLPTPAVCQLTQKNNQFNFGIIISASHNPYMDNGIKIIDAVNGKISLADEQNISARIAAATLTTTTYTTFGTIHQWHEAAHQYSSYIKTFFTPHFLYGKKIVLDCAHGALFAIAPAIFAEFGAELVVINNQPNGTNINHMCGALHTQQLREAVLAHNADIGFAFDGDGDRIMAINKHGELKDGDDILALLLEHPRYKHTPTIVGTDMTNQGFEQFLRTADKTLVRTRVGDKYVAQKLEQEQLTLGGEQSGHIIVRDYLDTGDGLFTALRVVESLIHSNNWDMNTFQKYPQILINVSVAVKKDLASPELAAIIAASNAQLNSGRLIVRYSGTENLLRIMVEDDELNNAHYVGTSLSQALQEKLS